MVEGETPAMRGVLSLKAVCELETSTGRQRDKVFDAAETMIQGWPSKPALTAALVPGLWDLAGWVGRSHRGSEAQCP